MSIASQCPGCSYRFTAPDQALGKSVRCPKCSHQFVVLTLPAADGFSFGESPDPEKATAAPRRGTRGLLVGLVAGLLVFGFLATSVAGYLVWTLLLRSATADWKEFSSAEGGFKVLLPPGSAQKEHADPKVIAITKIRAITAEPSRGENYTVQYYDLSDRPINDYLYFSWLKHHLLSGGGKLLRETDVAAGPYPGREIVVERDDQVIIRRIYLAEARVFWLTAQHLKSGTPSRSAQSFFDSFQVTSVPKVVASSTLAPQSSSTPTSTPATPPVAVTQPETKPPTTRPRHSRPWG